MTQLAGSAHRPQHAEALKLASERAYRAAERVWAEPVSPAPQSPGLLREPTRTTTAAPHGTSAPERTPSPNAPATATASPTPAPSATPKPAQRRSMPADSRRRLRRGPQPRLGGIPRRQHPQAVVQLQPPQGPARLRLRPALDPGLPTPLGSRPVPRLRPVRGRTRPPAARARVARLAARPSAQSAPDRRRHAAASVWSLPRLHKPDTDVVTCRVHP